METYNGCVGMCHMLLLHIFLIYNVYVRASTQKCKRMDDLKNKIEYHFNDIKNHLQHVLSSLLNRHNIMI